MSIRSLRGSAALLLCLGLTALPALAEEEPISLGTITSRLLACRSRC